MAGVHGDSRIGFCVSIFKHSIHVSCILCLTAIRYKPFANPDMQRLSSVCCFLLVTMSSVLLRSQSLLSSARPINFDPSSPNHAADTLPFDVRLTIFVILACIITPFIILLKPHCILKAFVLMLKSCWVRRQTRNQKLARADGSTNLMQLADAAPLATAGVSSADDSDLEMDIFSSTIRNVSTKQAVIVLSAGPLMDSVKPVVQRSARFAVSQRAISSPSVLNPIVSSPLTHAAVTNSLSVRGQHAAELVSRNSDDVSQAAFDVVLFEDIPAAPRSRSKSRALKTTPVPILSTAVRVSSSAMPTLSPVSSRVIVSAPLTRNAPAVSPHTPQPRSRFRPRDNDPSSAALICAPTALSATPILPAPGVITSAAAARPSPFASAALVSQTQRDRARAQRLAISDALAGATRTGDADVRLGDC